MRFTRLLVLLFALALVAAACSDDDDGGGDTTEAAGGETTETTAAAPATTEAAPPETEAPAETEAPSDDAEFGALGGVVVATGDPIEIRALQSISGATEFLGVDQVRGIELAIEDFGPIQGHEVSLGTVEDDLCNAEGGTAGAQAIVAQEGVLGVIGTTCSGAGVPAAQILSEAGLVMISGSNTSPSLTSDLQGTANEAFQPGYARTAHNDLFQGATAAQYAFEVLGVTKAAAIHDGDPYTNGLAQAFADAFEELGGEIVVFTAVNKGDTDMVPVLTEVAAGEPEVIFFPIFPPEGDFIVQQIDGVAGLEDVILFSADGMFVADFMQTPESEGLYFSGPNLAFESAGFTGVNYTDLVAGYEETYGEAPLAAFHAHTYDATMMLLSTIDTVAVEGPDGSWLIDRQELRDALYATAGFPGVTGVLSCDDFGDCGSQSIAVYFHEDSSSEDPLGDAAVVANSTLDGGFTTSG